MAFTKVVGAGIHTLAQLQTHNIHSAGIITATTFIGNIGGNPTFSGDATFNGNVSIGGTLTYEDVKNVDSVGIVTAREGIRIPFDNKFLLLGESNDLSLAHTAGHSYIADTGTGDLRITGSVIRIQNAVQNEDMAVFTQNGAVELYHDDDLRFSTAGYGATVFGTTETQKLNVTGISTFHHDVTLRDVWGYDNHIKFHYGNNTLNFPSASLSNIARLPKLSFGDRTSDSQLGVGDFRMYHDFYNMHMRYVGASGNFVIGNDNTSIHINGSNGSGNPQAAIRINAGANEGVKLYNGGNYKFETVGYGISVFGTTGTQQLNVTGVSTFVGIVTATDHINIITDNKKLQIGAGQDLALYHDGTNSRIHNTNTGSLIIRNEVQDADVYIQGNDGGSNVSLLSFDTSETGLATLLGELNMRGTHRIRFYYNTGNGSFSSFIGQQFTSNSFNFVINNQVNNIFVENDNIVFRGKNGQGDDTLAQFTKGGAVSLYHNGGSPKLATASHGINITGGFVATGDCSLADKLTHAGDENTAIRFPAADTISFETGGNERLRFESWGGIHNNQTAIYGGGVANEPTVHFNGSGPSNDLERGHLAVSHNAAYNASPIARIALTTRYNSSGGYTFMGGIEGGKANTTDNNFDGFVRLVVRKHGQGNIEGLRITSEGKVGINTNDPQKTLDVYGNIRGSILYLDRHGSPTINMTSTSDTGGGAIYFGSPASGIRGGILYDHNGDKLKLRNIYGTSIEIDNARKSTFSGDIQITKPLAGDPGANLTIQTHATAQATARLYFKARDNGNNEETCYIEAASGNTADVDLKFATNNSPKLYLHSNGYMSLGSAGAPTKFGIRGSSATTDATMQIVGNGVSTLLLGQNARGGVIRGQGAHNELSFRVGGNGDTAAATGGIEALRIDSGGGAQFVSQGTSIPVAGILHHTNNNLYVRGGTNGLILGNQDNTTTVQIYNNYIKFETNDGSEKFRIDSNGNLSHNSAGGGISYFKGSSEYVFGSSTSSPPAGGSEAKFQIHDHKTRATLSLNAYMANAGAPVLQFVSSRSGTKGTLEAKSALNDYHGDIRFMGDNGTNYNTLVQSAQILVRQKATISDGDTQCAGEMTFHVGSSTNVVEEKVRIDSGGGITLRNTGCHRGLIFIHDGDGGDSCTSMANVQGSGGRGIVETKIYDVAANTTTDLAKSHWGGLALIGWSGTGHQGTEQVSFGYHRTPTSQYKAVWVGNLTVTYTMSHYTLRISHNASNALNFWCILIGV